MSDYTTPYEPTAHDRNGALLMRGDAVVIERAGRYIHCDIQGFSNPAGLGALAQLHTRDGETLYVAADACALTRRHVQQRAA